MHGADARHAKADDRDARLDHASDYCGIVRAMTTRREIITITGGAAVALAATRVLAADAPKKDEDDVSPTEDLMREHGLVLRVVGVYQEAIRRAEAKEPLPLSALADTAKIVRNFVEDYHEKLEEDHVFPKLEKSNAALVKTLRAQHAAGRKLTDAIITLSTAATATADQSGQIVRAMQQFIREYLPHMAHEDTVLFPQLVKSMSEKEYDALGDQFEKREHELFGKDGFEGQVAKMAVIEKSLGIDDLAKFTPAG
jgi:hemerythrin-like domain-containing protein